MNKENEKIDLVFSKSENLSEDLDEEKPIRWINIIFLPFNHTWKFIVLLAVIIKCAMGPLSAIYSIHCTDAWDKNRYLLGIKYCYTYLADVIYVIDTFLYIVHRQVTDEAMRREYLPKPAFLFILDLLSLIPFFRLSSSAECIPTALYPNILAFNEILISYRIVQYFSLKLSHMTPMLFIGYFLLSALYIHCCASLLLLLTAQGLCENCHNGFFDWRYSVSTWLKENNTKEGIKMYLSASVHVLTITARKLIYSTGPATYLEYVFFITLMLVGYLLNISVLETKMFAESILRMRPLYDFHPRFKRIIDETKRRNPNPKAHLDVEKFYSLIWAKRNGVATMPEVFDGLPSYLKLNIKQDLMWPVLFHSPTFRKTSPSFKRWFCNYIHMHYKLPGEEFFGGPHCYSNLYYIRAGVVQLISSEDSVSSILSMTSGTILGDINFYIPPLHRNVKVQCLTYCEVLCISRAAILQSIHMFPEDRKMIMALTQGRIKHAQTLHNCKSNIKGLDRKEDEGLAWIKKRWWDINATVDLWKKCHTKDQNVCSIPSEEVNYHCPKYLGQIVLGTTVQLQKNSIFVRVTFPWILAPHSTFGDLWHQIVVITVFCVLIVLPPVIVNLHDEQIISKGFTCFQLLTDFVYAADIVVSIITAIEKEGIIVVGVMAILFERCKNVYFILDLLSTAWIENFILITDLDGYYYVVQFNRLLKIHVLFYNNYKKVWVTKSDLMHQVLFFIALMYFVFAYIISYFMFMLPRFIPGLSTSFFYGRMCSGNNKKTENCEAPGTLTILPSWVLENLFPEAIPDTISDVLTAVPIVVLLFLMDIYARTKIISALYLRYRKNINYYLYVSNLKKHYVRIKIHPHLLKRLQKYLECPWKYYNGAEIIMDSNTVSDLPYDIFTKHHGEIADNIIGQSKTFKNANPALIKELARKSKFLILPRESAISAFGVQVKNVTWLVKGLARCEYYDESGNKRTRLLEPGAEIRMLLSMLMKRASLYTFMTVTDCEVLYVEVSEFFRIIQRFPDEWSYMKIVESQLHPEYDKMYNAYFEKHSTRLKEVREILFHSTLTSENTSTLLKLFHMYRIDPESKFITVWLAFRALIVVVAITVAALKGGSGVIIQRTLISITKFCTLVGIIDIVIKLFLPYYDERGLIISDVRKTAIHYMTRGFTCDLIGVLPWPIIFFEVFDDMGQKFIMLSSTCLKFSHLYLLSGYFNYLANSSSSRFSIFMIIKWELLTVLLVLVASHFLTSECIDFDWDRNKTVVKMTRLNTCWIPNYLTLDENPTFAQLHLVFMESLILAQCGLQGKFNLRGKSFVVALVLFGLGCICWYVMCFSETLLILHYQGNAVYQQNIRQLKTFLESERVNKSVIDKFLNHFAYVRKRTRGINISRFINERIGAVCRQDLNYFFCQRTLATLDTLLGGGEMTARLLASNLLVIHFMPGEEIIRENELSHSLYIVHRGVVDISKNGQKLKTLTKGAIFGQLEGTVARPIRITAQAADYVDLLYLPITLFQDTIQDNIRETIALNDESKLDFMATKHVELENPYDTIEYIMFQDRNIIKLPWVTDPVSFDDNVWYARWLFLACLCGPLVTAVSVLLVEALPDANSTVLFNLNIALDILHLLHLISGFYTMEIVVNGDRCVKKYVRIKKVISWRFCLDIISLLVPYFALATNSSGRFQLFKLLRIHSVYLSQYEFSDKIKFFASPLVVKFLLVLLVLHTLTCGWIIIACKSKASSQFPINIPEVANSSVLLDTSEWCHPNERKQGCVRCFNIYQENNFTVGYVVPKHWYADYFVALCFILIIQTHTNFDSVVPLSINDMCYKLFITLILYFVEVYISSICISNIYTKLHEVYYYDYTVFQLIKYLRHQGLSDSLLHSVGKYSRLLWQRQRGTWLPELTKLAPECMREDLLSALYMHHLQNTPLLKTLPLYFLRQLVAKMKRVVIFPGNYVINEGDINPTIHFIHDGEVEKWFTNSNGEYRMITLLTGTVYFGLIPGLFPQIPYGFSYYTRTVVDLVYLRYEDWIGLLNSYPDLKRDLYVAANKLKYRF